MSEPDRTSDNSGKTPWNWILVTGALCAIPILPSAGGYPVVGFSMLAIVILAYWALVKVYGDGFVVEGGCLAIILAVSLFTAAPWFVTWLYDPPEGRVEAPPLVPLLILAVMGAYFVVMSVGFVVTHSLDRRATRLYKKADIRMIGGPVDGDTLNPGIAGYKWPPDAELVIHARVKKDKLPTGGWSYHIVGHVYERTEDGAYHFSGVLPEGQ